VCAQLDKHTPVRRRVRVAVIGNGNGNGNGVCRHGGSRRVRCSRRRRRCRRLCSTSSDSNDGEYKCESCDHVNLANLANPGTSGLRDFGTSTRQDNGVRFDATSVRYALNAGTSPASAPRMIMPTGVIHKDGSNFIASSTTPVCARTITNAADKMPP